MFDLIYRGKSIGNYKGVPIVGDTIEDHIIWQVDYHLRIAYLTD